MARLSVIFCVLGVGFSTVFASQDGVPALFWTNTKSDFPTPLAGHTTRQDEFKNDYLQNNIEKPGHVLVAFLQDKLSLEDIIDNADVYNEHSTGSKFANLKRLVETHTSVHLPAVFSPGETLDKLSENFNGKVHHVKAPYKMDHVVLDPSVANLVVAHLPHNDGKSFDKIDSIIGSVTDELKSMNVPFTAVYTGHKPSQDEPTENAYAGRHLLATEDSGETKFNTSCVLMYYQSIMFNVMVEIGKEKTPQRFSYKLENGDLTEHSCDNKTGSIKIKYPSVGDLTTGVTLDMNFMYDKYGYWNSSLEVTYSLENSTINPAVSIKNQKAKLQSDMIYGPKGFSYHCTPPNPIQQIGSVNATEVGKGNYASLSIEQFQIQFDEIKNGKFGRVNDCESFFSIAVLSGLFAGLVLTTILAFGICMIASISTMDRFDDPKGKTITVAVGE